ncbi:MAG TPA: pilus assembly protein PilM [candidate division Zixibacteria bacterium]|nr:pilus assembly protein PilM [candidate division Zixibacteria bacterium]
MQIDRESLQYCFATRTLSRATIKDFGKVYFPVSLTTEAERREFAARELRAALKQCGGAPLHWGISLSCEHSAVRTLRLPKMTQRELRSAVAFAAAKLAPFPLEEAHWDFRVTEERISDGAGEYQILFLAVERKHVEAVTETLALAGISPTFVYQDLETLGLSLRNLPGFNESLNYGLLNVRRTRTDISLYRGSNLEFLSRGAIGSLAIGIPGSVSRNSATDPLPRLLENFTEGLINEVQNSLDYYGAFSSVGEIERFYIYGDLAYSDELITRLSDRFGIVFERYPVTGASRKATIPAELLELAPACLPTVAAASARRRLCDLISTDVRRERGQRRFRRLAYSAAAALAVLCGAWTLNAVSRARSAEGRADELQRQVTALENSPGFVTHQMIEREIRRRQQELTELKPSREERYLVLKELSTLTPVSIELSYLDYFPPAGARRTQLAGVARSATTAPETQLAEFVARLEHSPIFSGVTLLKHTKDIKNDLRVVMFTLEMDATL